MENAARLYERLTEELAALPRGYISKKTIKGNTQYYLQWREDGKLKSKYIGKDKLADIERQIARRKEIEPIIEKLKSELPERRNGKVAYKTNVATCDMVQNKIDDAAKLPKRDCYARFIKCLYYNDPSRITALYGLRRTGKTTMIFQAISEMPEDVREKTVYIKLTKDDNMGKLIDDIYRLREEGYRYLFIDEVTLAEDFIDGASIFSDVFAAMGMRIVLAGTDSLGFWLASGNELYDRVRMIHTTFIPYREYSRLLGIDSIDEYIRYGGTLRLGEVDFDDEELSTEEVSFRDDESARRYSDTAIAQNIQHSLACFEFGKNFRHLFDLYDAGELTNAINRIVEDINHRFVLRVLTKDFVSSDLGISARNLRTDKDETRRTDILEHVDREAITKRLMNILDIRNEEERRIGIRQEHIAEIREYLRVLDLTQECPFEYVAAGQKREEHILFTQPGMRYCQAQALVHSLMKDETFGALSGETKEYVTERILEEVRGRMMEDIILLETLKALPKKRYEVFKLQLTNGEFDMVVWDRTENRCALYEIKHSTEYADLQARHLRDEEKLRIAEYKYGRIVGRYVLYNGEVFDTEDGIAYRNAEQFLKALPDFTLESGLKEIASENENQGFTPTM